MSSNANVSSFCLQKNLSYETREKTHVFFFNQNDRKFQRAVGDTVTFYHIRTYPKDDTVTFYHIRKFHKIECLCFFATKTTSDAHKLVKSWCLNVCYISFITSGIDIC